MNPTTFFSHLWADYITITPQAEKIRALFEAAGEQVVNDHVAFRTFAHTPLQLDKLELVILALGYRRQDEYFFRAKKLRAYSFIHTNPDLPKIFCSELLSDQLSASAQHIIARYSDQIIEPPLEPGLFWSGRHWLTPSWQDYSALLAESEYAAWLLAMGIRANHFTISINHLSGPPSIQAVLAQVKQAGFAINSVGGEVKGNPAILLEQGATLADRQRFVFAAGDAHEIPTCFYEFALRYADANGVLYQGFVEANADKIFESTHQTNTGN